MGGDGRQRGGASGFTVEAFEERHEAVGIGVGLDVAERNLEQRAVAGRAASDVDPEVQASSATLGEQGGRRFRQHQAELIPESLLSVADLEARDSVQLGGDAVRAVTSGSAAGGHTGFAAGEDGRAGDGGDEGLVGADIGRGLILADMLLPGGEHHDDAIAAGVVLGLADKTTRRFADFILTLGVVADGEDAEAGAAEVGADGEVLTFAD